MKPPVKSRPRRKSTRGFTLVELMVVILIVVLLVALSFMGLRKAREFADRAASVRNLSQLQIANSSYSADHNGRYVPLYATDEDGERTGRWFQDPTFLSYLAGARTNASGEPIRAAPSEYLDPKVLRARQEGYTSMAASFGMNQEGLMGLKGPSINASHYSQRIHNLSASMAFATATDFRVGHSGRFGGPELGRSNNGSMAYRHGGKALVVYFDGHVSQMSEAEIREFDKSRGGRNSAFWNPSVR